MTLPTKPTEAQIADTNAFIQNTQMMRQIVQEMKEVPELPSEIPTDVHGLLRVEFPDNGGIHTYMEGYDEPYRGFPFAEFVDKIDTLKKIFRGALSSLYHSFKVRPKVQLALLIVTPWILNDIIDGALYSAHRVISRFLIKPLRYSEPVREIHRACSIQFYGESEQTREGRKIVKDILCMLLENDNAYRFRFQDVLVELNKDALSKRQNPSRELVRLLKLMQSREKLQEIKDTWKLIIIFLPVYLFFNRTVRKQVRAVLRELDLAKIKLSKEDEHFCKPRVDYQFRFMELCQPTSILPEEKLRSQKQSPSVAPTPSLSGHRQPIGA